MLQMIIVQLIFFAGLVLVLRKVLISSSYAETKRLQELSKENAQRVEKLDGKISDTETQYKEKMDRAAEKIKVMKAKATEEVEQLKAEIIAKGKEESERIVKQALGSKEEMRAEIADQMHADAATFSSKIFQKIFAGEEQKLVHDGFLESVIHELSEIEKDRLQAADLDGSSSVEVKTAHPLSPAQKEKLEKVLSSQLDQKVTIQESVDKQLIAGIAITIGSIIIDGSLSERFKKAAQSRD